MERLKTILDLDEFFAMLIRYEMDKIERFSTSNRLCAYAGASALYLFFRGGGKTYHGRIIKQGNKYLKWALIEVVVTAARKDAQIRSYYYSMKAKKGSNYTKVAIARRFLKIVYQVWKENRFYRTKTLGIALIHS